MPVLNLKQEEKTEKRNSKAHCHKVSLKVGQRKVEMCHASGFLDWIA